jgi:hypothetical protein
VFFQPRTLTHIVQVVTRGLCEQLLKLFRTPYGFSPNIELKKNKRERERERDRETETETDERILEGGLAQLFVDTKQNYELFVDTKQNYEGKKKEKKNNKRMSK